MAVGKPIPNVNPDGIADEMKFVDRWIMWHGAWNPQKAKYDKIPCDVNGKRLNAHDPANWTGFEDAYDAHVCDPDTVSGIGFDAGFDEASGLTFWLFDDDKRVHGIKAEPELQAILDGFPYGSRELSPSGEGVRVFFATEGEAEYYHKNPDGNPSELYNGGQFGTATGNEFQNGYPFIAPMEAVERLIELAGLPPIGGSHAHEGAVSESTGNAGDGERPTPSRYELKRAESMLAVISPDIGYESWVSVGMALHDAGFPIEVWDKWSRKGKKYEEGVCQKKWVSFGTNPDGKVVTFGYITMLAYQNGWMPENPPVISPFYIKHGELWRYPKSKNGADIRVTSTPPYILADITDIDSGNRRALVGMKLPNGYGKTSETTVVVNRSELFDKTMLFKLLADLGGNLSSSNAAFVVEYMTACDGAPWAANRPRYMSVARMGWVGNGALFMPYDDDMGECGTRFDPPHDMALLSSAFDKPRGTLAEWVEFIGPLRAKSIMVRMVIAASFASPLLELLGVQSFVVYIWGASQSGKSVTVKIAGSVWGDPRENAGYYSKLSDTDVSTYKRAGLIHNMPLLLDEFESRPGKNDEAKRASMQKLAYDLSYGMEKNRGTRSASFNQGASWCLLTISAGETPITGDTTQQGALNRILEVNGEPFADRRAAGEAHKFVSSHHGAAGREFIRRLKACDLEELAEEFDAIRAMVADVLPDNPQQDFIAVLAFADMLADRFVFNPGTVQQRDAAAEGAAAFAKALALHTKSVRDRDTDRRAIEFVSEWLTMNTAHFKNQKYTNEIAEPYGVIETCLGDSGDVRIWYVMGQRLAKALEDAGYNRAKTIRRMHDESILIPPKKGRGQLVKKSIDGKPRNCYAIDEEALGKFIFPDEEEA